MLDAVNATVEKHLRDFSDAKSKNYGGYPADIASRYAGLVDNNFSEELRIESLRSLTFDKHTVNEVLGAVKAQDSVVFFKN